MALLFMDSFDHYVTADLGEKWTQVSSVTIVAAAGRNGTSACRGTSTSRVLGRGITTASSTIILGLAVKPTSPGSPVLQIGDALAQHVGLWTGADGSLLVGRPSNLPTWDPAAGPTTLLGTSAAGLMSLSLYNHVQYKVTIANSGGTAEVRVNGVTVLSLSGLDTRNGAGGTGIPSIVSIGGNNDIDDLWVCDDTGPAPWNTFLGDCRVDARFPTAAGATTGWTPSTGANWAAVDDAAPNDDTDYTSAAAAALTDTFVTQDAPVAGATIYGVQHCLAVKKSDAGFATIAPVIRHGTTNYPGADLAPGTTYAYALSIAATNPGTSAQWTEAGFNAAEFGYTRTA